MNKLYLYDENEVIIPVDSIIDESSGRSLLLDEIQSDDEQNYIFKTEISGERLEGIFPEGLSLVIFNLQAADYEIYFNGLIVGREGINKPISFIKNHLGIYIISNSLVKESNILEIHARSTHLVGIPRNYPVLLTNRKKAAIISIWHTVFFHGYLLMCMGIAFFAIPFSLINLLSNKKKSIVLGIDLLMVSLIIHIYSYLGAGRIIFSQDAFYRIYYCNLSLIAFGIMFFINSIFPKRHYISLTPFIIFITSCILAFVVKMPLHSFGKIIVILAIIDIAYIIAIMIISYFQKKLMPENLVYGIYIVMAFGLDVALFNYPASVTILFLIILYVMLNVSASYTETQSKYAEQKVLATKLNDKIIRDQMTGLFNHNYIKDLSMTLSPPYSIVMADIDNFKAVNDCMGHEHGDNILLLLGDIMNNTLAGSGYVGRYGGDEFLLIMPGKTDVEAASVCSMIMEEFSIAVSGIKELSRKIPTVSMGIFMVRDASMRESAAYRADQALYQAKAWGKNQIIIHKCEG